MRVGLMRSLVKVSSALRSPRKSRSKSNKNLQTFNTLEKINLGELPHYYSRPCRVVLQKCMFHHGSEGTGGFNKLTSQSSPHKAQVYSNPQPTNK